MWQVALEVGYQRQLAQRLLGAGSVPPNQHEIEVQAAFYIDVRSEPLRRSLEAIRPAVQTIEFTGFFGLPLAHTPLGASVHAPHLPGLLAPAVEATDYIVPSIAGALKTDATLQETAIHARSRRFTLADQRLFASRRPGAALSFAEAAGVGYTGKLGQWLWPFRQARVNDALEDLPTRYRPLCRPQLMGLDIGAKVSLAAQVLRSMGLDDYLAPLVLLVGHSSQSANNAHAAALDCGACCGQTGEVSARSLAQLLNEPAVRMGLVEQDIAIPESTTFVVALHNTITDEIEGFDLDLLPPVARQRWNSL